MLDRFSILASFPCAKKAADSLLCCTSDCLEISTRPSDTRPHRGSARRSFSQHSGSSLRLPAAGDRPSGCSLLLPAARPRLLGEARRISESFITGRSWARSFRRRPTACLPAARGPFWYGAFSARGLRPAAAHRTPVWQAPFGPSSRPPRRREPAIAQATAVPQAARANASKHRTDKRASAKRFRNRGAPSRRPLTSHSPDQAGRRLIH